MNKDRIRNVLFQSLWNIVERLPQAPGPQRALLLQEFDLKVRAFYSVCNCPASRQAVEPLIHAVRSYQ